MKYLLFNFMLYFRGVFFLTVKGLALFLFIGGVGCLFFDPTLWGKFLGVPMAISPFLLFLLRRHYDGILLRLRPDGTGLALPID